MICHKCVSGYYRKYPSVLCSSHSDLKPDINLPEAVINNYNKTLATFHETCFIKKFISGQVKATDIDDYIDQWHNSESSYELHTFLGLSEHEYKDFVVLKKNIEQIRDERIKTETFFKNPLDK